MLLLAGWLIEAPNSHSCRYHSMAAIPEQRLVVVLLRGAAATAADSTAVPSRFFSLSLQQPYDLLSEQRGFIYTITQLAALALLCSSIRTFGARWWKSPAATDRVRRERPSSLILVLLVMVSLPSYRSLSMWKTSYLMIVYEVLRTYEYEVSGGFNCQPGSANVPMIRCPLAGGWPNRVSILHTACGWLTLYTTLTHPHTAPSLVGSRWFYCI